ncbi:hypothetical protein CFOL_v3_31842 [Cephalotus follicularis]|uniref:Uncharacterized protein n=1 Tax=Cephalotus follicularis TaxID=3775 RepID=A0A1Q3D7H1_CEPFO|nr:hypothetical protein CFOL_v3_31842 [Cephalotus follicularis]
MSKKKALSGSTMSLKDFHGGSIPSDLLLPSAPGLVVMPGSDRNMLTNRGNNLMRPDPRPKSSDAARIFDEKASFFSHPAPIGQNFDEDERKPLYGISALRLTISDDSLRTSPPISQELWPENVSSVRVPGRPASSPVPQSSSLGNGSCPRTGEENSFGVKKQTPISNHGPVVNYLQSSCGDNCGGVKNAQPPSGNDGQGVIDPPNAWGVRRDRMGINMSGGDSVLSGPKAVSKVVQASALEKVSLGMWQSKSHIPLLPHILYTRMNNVPNGVKEKGEYDDSRKSQAESGWIAEDGNQGAGTESLSYEMDRSQMLADEFQNSSNICGLISPPESPASILERSKLNLISRFKTLETSEDDYRQQPAYYGHAGYVNVKEVNENDKASKPESAVAEGGNQPIERLIERPKLNLKPRSKPLEQSDEIREREREKLFGGARPREMVLKQRGVEESSINNHNLNHSVNRVNSPKNAAAAAAAAASEHLVPTACHSDKRTGKHLARKEQWRNHEKSDNPRRNRQTDEKREGRGDTEKHLQDRRTEPDTWRKPIEDHTPASTDASGIRHGKLVSAVELTQAFSKPITVLKTVERFSAQSGLPACSNQMPFSRLTGSQEPTSAPTSMHRINGY